MEKPESSVFSIAASAIFRLQLQMNILMSSFPTYTILEFEELRNSCI